MIRPEDLSAWEKAPITDLETNSEFAAMPLEVRRLTDFPGCRYYIYTENRDTSWQQRWLHAGAKFVKCSHQFEVCLSVVLSYTAVGECASSCAQRPASHRCTLYGI